LILKGETLGEIEFCELIKKIEDRFVIYEFDVSLRELVDTLAKPQSLIRKARK
jgi:hypothetical protein